MLNTQRIPKVVYAPTYEQEPKNFVIGVHLSINYNWIHLQVIHCVYRTSICFSGVRLYKNEFICVRSFPTSNRSVIYQNLFRTTVRQCPGEIDGYDTYICICRSMWAYSVSACIRCFGIECYYRICILECNYAVWTLCMTTIEWIMVEPDNRDVLATMEQHVKYEWLTIPAKLYNVVALNKILAGKSSSR